MASFRANIVANLGGAAWIAGLTIAITPLQIRLLGIEAYGLVALISVLQIAVAVLDLGLSATVTRQIAADAPHRNKSSLDLIDTASTVYWLIALLIAAAIYAGAPVLAANWFRGATLSQTEVTQGIQLIAAYVALRWPVAFYAGVLSGVQRMDVLNVIKAGSVTLRLGGGLVLLLIFPSLMAFLSWFVASAMLELLGYAIACYRLLPGMSMQPRFSLATVRQVWRFSAAMNLIAIISVFLTQTDRFVVGTLLGLEALGYYSLAYNTAHGIALIPLAISGASLPAFSSAFGRDDEEQLRSRQDKASQVIIYTVVLPCFALVFFGHDILRLWVGVQEADASWAALLLLAVGFLLNAIVYTSYIVAIACGRPGLVLKVNLVGLALYLPSLYVGTLYFGIEGAAACWLVLNIYYLFSLVPLVQRGLLRQSFGGWLSENVTPFVLVGLACFGAPKIALQLGAVESLSVGVGALVLGTCAYCVAGYFLLSAALRRDLWEVLGRPWMSRT